MSDLIISVSGLRGIVGESLDPLVAARYAAAFASHAPPGAIVVGRDGRSSGPLLRDVISGALRAAGRDVIDADVAATPTVGVLVRQHGAAGAVQISASHNPPPYNGFKLFGSDGRVLQASAGAAVRQTYLGAEPAWAAFDAIGRLDHETNPHATHLQLVLETVDAEAIRSRRFRVLLDSNHGAGGRLGRWLLETLGCQLVAIGEDPDGRFEHPPEPTAENLQTIAAHVREHQCDIGFCQDPDADRLAVIDGDGRYIGEEYTLALCVQRALSKADTAGPVVINCATSSISQRLAQAAGVPIYRSAVGEANVADMMIQRQATYGGEGNGGPIDPRVGYVRDSFVGMAQILELMQSTGRSVAQLADALPRLAIHKTTARLAAEQLPEATAAIAAAMPEAETDTLDGLRLSWPDRWLLVRGSNTEPIVRLIAEAPTAAEAQGLCQQAAAVIETTTAAG